MMSPVLFTSIAPRRIEAQKAAVETWTKLSIRVVSLNYLHEKPLLESHFPHVEFRYVRLGLVDHLRKWKYIALKDALALVAEINPPGPFGLINSDILLVADPFRVLRQQESLDLLIASRLDVDTEAGPTGQVYQFGFDLFAFRTSQHLASFRRTPYFFGVPWWDYWLPLVALKAGLKVGLWESMPPRHVVHAERYDTKLYDRFGKIFIGQLPFFRQRHLSAAYRSEGLNGLATATARLIRESSVSV